MGNRTPIVLNVRFLNTTCRLINVQVYVVNFDLACYSNSRKLLFHTFDNSIGVIGFDQMTARLTLHRAGKKQLQVSTSHSCLFHNWNLSVLFNLPLISFLLFNPHAYSEPWVHVVYCRNPLRSYMGITLKTKRSDNGPIPRITVLCDTKFIRKLR